ncbi:FecR domain-containing protein [Alienimonas sp. DA493]|uniref:FecR domain-containing protein n=1 Tax=Alienimonas sp. DA493 TaxID=3373605 RepID=UPI003754CE1E
MTDPRPEDRSSDASRPERSRFDELWCDYLEGGLDAAGLAELGRLLDGRPDLLAEAAASYETHRLLGVHLQPASGDAFRDGVLAALRADRDGFVGRVAGAVRPARPLRPRPPLSRLRGYGLVAALTLLCSLGVQWAVFGRAADREPPAAPAAPREYVATLVRGDGCRFVDAAPVSDGAGDAVPRPVRPGSRLTGGTIRSGGGTAVVRFDGGASVALTGASRLTIESAGTAVLESGAAVVRTPEEAAGFMLRTPASDLIDLGTEFAVSVGATGETEVHVTEGEVEWHRPEGDGGRDRSGAGRRENSGARLLSAGQAVRLSVGTAAAVPIPLSARRFAELAREGRSPRGDGRLLAFDDFDYPMERSASGDAEADGGFGWTTHWYRGWPRSDQVLDFDPDHSLDAPPGLAAATGGSLEFPAEPDLKKKFREASKRRLAEPIDLNSDSVRYVSVLLRRDAESAGRDDEWFRFMLVASANRKQRMGFGVLSDRRPIVFNLEGNATAPDRVGDGETCLLVAKIVCGRDRPDQTFLKVYRPGEPVDPSEPLEWTVAGRMVDRRERLDELHLYNGRDHAYVADELRYGATWESVTPPAVPGG